MIKHRTIRIPIADLNPAPYNPRQISDAALKALAESIKVFSAAVSPDTAEAAWRK